MGNQNCKTTKSNHIARLEMLTKATDFVLKMCCSAIDHPRSKKRVRRSKDVRHSKHKRNVCFNDTVNIRTIEHHSWYTKEERKACWRSVTAIRLHAMRNSIEMKWEGKNWRNATEESDMFFDIENGVRFHPCWIITPPLPYHGGEILYGTNLRLASYNLHLMFFIQRYGLTAFAGE